MVHVEWKSIALRLARCIRKDDGYTEEEAQMHAEDAIDFGCRFDAKGQLATTCQCGPQRHAVLNEAEGGASNGTQ